MAGPFIMVNYPKRGFLSHPSRIEESVTVSDGPPGQPAKRRSGQWESAPAAPGRRDDGAVTVEKAVELIGTGDSVQDAVTEALDRARLTLEGITGFEVTRISGAVDGAATEYRVELRVWFVLRERMHG